MTLRKSEGKTVADSTVQVPEVQSSFTIQEKKQAVGIVSDEDIEKKEQEAHLLNLNSINDQMFWGKDDSNVIPDSSNICTNDNQVDQNAAECANERTALANLIANLTLDTEENKTICKVNKEMQTASLTKNWKKSGKTNLDTTSRGSGGGYKQSG
ncbi:hypothetical protein Tco_0744834 [Tanacetum coccineum]